MENARCHACIESRNWHGAMTLVVLVVAVACTAGIAFGVAQSSRETAKSCYASVEVVVMPGDTLWSIARRHFSKETDLRAAVDEMMRDNNLSSSGLHPGQVIQVKTPVESEASPRIAANE